MAFDVKNSHSGIHFLNAYLTMKVKSLTREMLQTTTFDWFADRGERPVVSSCPLPWNLKFEKNFLTLDRIEKSSHFSE